LTRRRNRKARNVCPTQPTQRSRSNLDASSSIQKRKACAGETESRHDLKSGKALFHKFNRAKPSGHVIRLRSTDHLVRNFFQRRDPRYVDRQRSDLAHPRLPLASAAGRDRDAFGTQGD
jgi:hypothetical protein